MPISRKQTCFIDHPDFYGQRNHGYFLRPVCPVPESQREEIILWSEEKKSYFHWYPNGGVAQFLQDGTEIYWPKRPSLQAAVLFKSKAASFFRFRSNGDIHVIDSGEPFFFSGVEEEVEAEKGELIDMTPPDDDWSDQWSDDSYDRYDSRCGCYR